VERRSEKSEVGTVHKIEHTDERVKQFGKKEAVISILLGLYILCSFLVISSLEECPSELGEAVFYTFLLLFGYLLIRKRPRTKTEESSIWIIMYIVWILLLIQFWVNAILECMRGF